MSKKKIAIISICILIVSIGIGTTIGWAINHFNDEEEVKEEVKIKEDWAKDYYEYLKDEDDIIPEKSKKTTLNFVEIDGLDSPIMVIKYTLNKEENTKLYYLDDDSVKELKFDSPFALKVLYSIEDEDINYYIEVLDGKTGYYETVSSIIKKGGEKLPKNEISHNKETIKNDNGKKVEITEFEQTYIEISLKEYDDVELIDIKKDKLKKLINECAEEVETIKDYNKKDIKDKIESIEEKLDKIEEIKKEQEEIEEQKRLEEEKKKQEEEEAKKKEEEEKKESNSSTGNDIYNKIKGYYCNPTEGEYECIRIYKKGNKGYYEDFVPASEMGGVNEITSVSVSKSIYTLKLNNGNQVKINTANINSKYILVNNTKFEYITTDSSKIQDILFGG